MEKQNLLMASLFKALMALGFERVAPRTLQRGGVVIIAQPTLRNFKWILHSQFGTAVYYSQKQLLHGLVLHLALTKEELQLLASMGIEYAKDELLNYEKTMKRVEAGGIKAIKNYIELLEKKEKEKRKEANPDYLRKIVDQFRKQVIYPQLEKILEENNGRCPVCGKLMFDVSRFYSHLKSASLMKDEHRALLKKIEDLLTE